MSNQPFKHKNALITGSSQGMGLAIARDLAARGAAVALNAPDEAALQKAERAAQAIRAAGGQAVAVQADVTSVEQIAHLFTTARAAHGELDFVISCVGGVGDKRGFTKFADVDERLWDATTTLTAKSTFFVLQHAAACVRDHGRIIAISSIITRTPYPGVAIYAGAKAAVEVYCKTLAKEIGHRGITVNSIAPGLTLTEGVDMYGVPPERFEAVKTATPLGRLGTPQDISESVMTLLSKDAHWLTGQCMAAAGGFV